MSAMVPGRRGCPEFMRLVAAAITKWPRAGRQPCARWSRRDLQGSAPAGCVTYGQIRIDSLTQGWHRQLKSMITDSQACSLGCSSLRSAPVHPGTCVGSELRRERP
jgi:hypothetical protein